MEGRQEPGKENKVKRKMQPPSQPPPHSVVPSGAQSGSGACVRVFARARELEDRPEQGGGAPL